MSLRNAPSYACRGLIIEVRSLCCAPGLCWRRARGQNNLGNGARIFRVFFVPRGLPAGTATLLLTIALPSTKANHGPCIGGTRLQPWICGTPPQPSDPPTRTRCGSEGPGRITSHKPNGLDNVKLTQPCCLPVRVLGNQMGIIDIMSPARNETKRLYRIVCGHVVRRGWVWVVFRGRAFQKFNFI